MLRFCYVPALFCCLLIAACNNGTHAAKIHLADTATIKTFINTDSITAEKKDDSLEKAFENGEIVSAYVVRLDEHSDAFVALDTIYRKDTYLLKDSCEDYYRYARKMIPAADRQAFRLAWSVKEVKAEAGSGGWSGYHGVYTRIEERPSDDGSGGYYWVSVKRAYENREGRVTPIGFMRIKLHPQKILIETEDGNEVELARWRKLPEEEQ